MLNNILDMDNLAEILPKDKYPEVILEFNEINNKKKIGSLKKKNNEENLLGEFKININYDKGLSMERKILETKAFLFKNVLIIYINTVSRPHFLRKMPKTSKFIEQFLKKQYVYLKNLSSSYLGCQFMKYQCFGSGTFRNIIPMFYGNRAGYHKGINLIKHYKKGGYVTAYSIDMCSKEVWEPEKETGYEFIQWDHENVAMFCEPSYIRRDARYLIYRGAYSLLKRCFYGKQVHDYVFEYGKKFWEAYKDNKKFLRLVFNDGDESTFEVTQYLDEPLYEFLNEFYNKRYLNDTSLLILSDQGNHIPGIYNLLASEDCELERTLGTLFIIINNPSSLYDRERGKSLFEKYSKNAIENQQNLITLYDIHDTLIHIVIGQKSSKFYSRKGTSIFLMNKQNSRTCEDYSNFGNETLCRCINNEKLGI